MEDKPSPWHKQPGQAPRFTNRTERLIIPSPILWERGKRLLFMEETAQGEGITTQDHKVDCKGGFG